jgi:hypothetical protein
MSRPYGTEGEAPLLPYGADGEPPLPLLALLG